MEDSKDTTLKHIDELLNIPDQSWLLGAGISKEAGIPLMNPLTDRIKEVLDENYEGETYPQMFEETQEVLPEGSNVEDVLSHIGDLIAICKRSRDKICSFNGQTYGLKTLKDFHSVIQKVIREIIRFGYKPANSGNKAIIGDEGKPIVRIDNHLAFIKALFEERRAGLGRRPPVKFFTTNYDTLLEDSLALSKLNYIDGFSGGAMAFWNPDIYENMNSQPVDALLYKFHGSIDWFVDKEEVVVRRREGAIYPDKSTSRLLIYPQATKYMLTQKDPFAKLFLSFRESLIDKKSGLLGICGYSFSDNHINEEINQAMSVKGNSLTIFVFVKQDGNKLDGKCKGLPPQIYRWLSSNTNWKNRLVVATDYGFFHGSLQNELPANGDTTYDWWTFEGLTKLLKGVQEK